MLVRGFSKDAEQGVHGTKEETKKSRTDVDIYVDCRIRREKLYELLNNIRKTF